MKKANRFWNYIDMFLQVFLITSVVIGVFNICLNLEKYVYRFTIFPIFALISIFIMGILFGRNLERTRKFKPVGLFSKIMTKSRKEKNSFIFRDDEETYLPKKRMIEEIKSGNINHIKQYQNSNIEYDENDFKDIYSIDIDDIIDHKQVNLDKDDEENDNETINSNVINLENINNENIKKENKDNNIIRVNDDKENK